MLSRVKYPSWAMSRIAPAHLADCELQRRPIYPTCPSSFGRSSIEVSRLALYHASGAEIPSLTLP